MNNYKLTVASFLVSNLWRKYSYPIERFIFRGLQEIQHPDMICMYFLELSRDFFRVPKEK